MMSNYLSLEIDLSQRFKSNIGNKVFGPRINRLLALLLAIVLVHEASSRTSGFTQGPIVCPVRLLTGFPCPGCGTTRAIGAISSGDFEQAWSLNPIAFLVCAIAITCALKITPLNRLILQVSNLFRSRSTSNQVAFLLLLYVFVWMTAISRFNSGTL
jgi:hypothetical protein